MTARQERQSRMTPQERVIYERSYLIASAADLPWQAQHWRAARLAEWLRNLAQHADALAEAEKEAK